MEDYLQCVDDEDGIGSRDCHRTGLDEAEELDVGGENAEDQVTTVDELEELIVIVVSDEMRKEGKKTLS